MKILRGLLLFALLTGAGSLLLAELARPLETAKGSGVKETSVEQPPTLALADATGQEKPVSMPEPVPGTNEKSEIASGSGNNDHKEVLDAKDYKEVLDAKDYKEALPEVGEGPIGGPGSLGAGGGAFGSPAVLPPPVLPPELPPGNDVTTPTP